MINIIGWCSVFRVENDDVEKLKNEHAVDNPDEIAASVEMWVFFFLHCFSFCYCSIYKIRN